MRPNVCFQVLLPVDHVYEAKVQRRDYDHERNEEDQHMRIFKCEEGNRVFRKEGSGLVQHENKERYEAHDG